MSVKLSIELTSLQDPGVSKALSQLMLALGQWEAGHRGTPAPSPAVFEALSPAPTLQAPVQTHVSPPPPRTRPAPPAPIEDSRTDAERYAEFVQQLPDRSRQFLDLVRERGTLGIDDAMKAMNITVPKALGGITGSIGRWAPARGVKVPYTAIMLNGRRAWRWIGTPDDQEVATSVTPEPVAPVFVAPASVAPASVAPASVAPASVAPASVAPASVAPASVAPASVAPASVAPASVAPASVTPASVAPASVAPASVAPTPVQVEEDWAGFFQALPERSRRFMQLLTDQRVLYMSDVLKAFGLSRAKAAGGLTEPVQRLGQQYGIEEPFETAKLASGERYWSMPGAAPEERSETPASSAPPRVTPIVEPPVLVESGTQAGGVRRRRRAE